MTTNTEKGTEVVKITALVEKDPNAPAKVNATATGTSSVLQAQPGHEGHNH